MPKEKTKTKTNLLVDASGEPLVQETKIRKVKKDREKMKKNKKKKISGTGNTMIWLLGLILVALLVGGLCLAGIFAYNLSKPILEVGYRQMNPPHPQVTTVTVTNSNLATKAKPPEFFEGVAAVPNTTLMTITEFRMRNRTGNHDDYIDEGWLYPVTDEGGVLGGLYGKKPPIPLKNGYTWKQVHPQYAPSELVGKAKRGDLWVQSPISTPEPGD
jgi:hypothetical protein